MENAPAVQIHADLSVAQFWMQKVAVLAAMAQAGTRTQGATISNLYSLIVQYFANYENEVAKKLMNHAKPAFLTLVRGNLVSLGRNTEPRDGNYSFADPEFSE